MYILTKNGKTKTANTEQGRDLLKKYGFIETPARVKRETKPKETETTEEKQEG